MKTLQETLANGAWANLFKIPPRYIWDESTKTLCLDGDWSGERIISRTFYLSAKIKIDPRHISQLYLGDNFMVDSEEPMDILKLVPISVSSKNEEFKSVNQLLVSKSTNKPVLDGCGKGYYFIVRNDLVGIVDEKCNQITPCKYDYVEAFRDNGLCAVRAFDYKSGDRWGMVNKEGVEQIPLMYDRIYTESDGKIRVTIGSKEFYINENNRPIR